MSRPRDVFSELFLDLDGPLAGRSAILGYPAVDFAFPAKGIVAVVDDDDFLTRRNRLAEVFIDDDQLTLLGILDVVREMLIHGESGRRQDGRDRGGEEKRTGQQEMRELHGRSRGCCNMGGNHERRRQSSCAFRHSPAPLRKRLPLLAASAMKTPMTNAAKIRACENLLGLELLLGLSGGCRARF